MSWAQKEASRGKVGRDWVSTEVCHVGQQRAPVEYAEALIRSVEG